ncbi:hypothetical protein ABN034_08730 [Actinopolymorpha sp. B11F2]|uniref:WD40/YVTN/BNR-like repeat-containing protein n=1 Tax=Actinopolymorpha sp. B11F2 TaxID=3160862 RepID=UPI0032E45ACF
MSRLRMLGAVGLAAMVALDVVLVVLAVRHTHAGSPAMTGIVATPAPTASHSATPGTDPAGSPTATGDPGATVRPALDPGAPRVLVDIGAAGAVARAVTGACGTGGATIALSRDGGESFQRASVPAAAVVLRVASVDAEQAWVVAAGADCATLTTFTTTDGGGTWTPSNGSDGSWHRLPVAGARIHAPTGDVDVPCPRRLKVLGYSTLSRDQAYVLCGREGAAAVLLRTVDGGASWSDRGEMRGAVDLDFVSATTGLAAVVGDRSCAGISVHASTDAGASWKPRACVETTAGGFPDITADGDRAYLGVGEALWFSGDGGRTWASRPA